MAETQNIICTHCGLIDDYTTTVKANNHVATCNGCGSFIKNIPHSKPSLYFGMYKGKPIDEFDGKEIEYLYWVRNHADIWPGLNKRTQDAINLRLDGHL